LVALVAELRFASQIFLTTLSLIGMVACSFSLLGCANPLNVGHYERYMDAGLRAEDRGDYLTARRHFIRARANSAQGFLGKEAESAAVYNIARMNGLLGYYEIAEKQLKEALKLEEKVYGPDRGHASMRWFELARLYYAWGRYQDSVAAYEKGFPMAADAQKTLPAMYAACLRDFADALDKVGDSSRAKELRARAASISEQPSERPIRYYPKKENP
jgi:tetratricopeptide (TPR) repeat protein